MLDALEKEEPFRVADGLTRDPDLATVLTDAELVDTHCGVSCQV